MSNAIRNYAGTTKTAKVERTRTPQTRRTPGRTDEVRNNAGGFVFEVSDKDRLERFLILGTDGGTYYTSERKLTEQNMAFVKALIRKNSRGVIDVLANVADENRAPKNAASIFTLALVLAEENSDKMYLRESGVVNKVVRTSTHLFEFANYIDALGGWGRAKRSAVAMWYEGKDANQLAYQAVKYRQRDGWTHRDLFRKVHPVGVDSTVGNFILGKGTGVNSPDSIRGFAEMQNAGTVKEVVSILNKYKNLPWETIPTQFLTEKKVWETLFYNGAIGQTALLRNVTRFAKLGMFDDMVFAGDVSAALADKDRIVKGRLHPVAYANALGIYGKGAVGSSAYGYGSHGARSINWTPNAKVLGAIEAGFYESFAAVEPANKATYVAVDVSGSMTWGAPAGLVGMNYMEAAAVMAMVTVRTEPYAVIKAFSTGMQEVGVSDADSLATVIQKFSSLSFGGTDVAAPIVDATKNRLKVDTFVVYSDMETWAGDRKPFQALEDYRQSSGRKARLAAVGLASTGSTVTDPKDKGSLNLVGFDSTAPRVLADFSAGRI